MSAKLIVRIFQRLPLTNYLYFRIISVEINLELISPYSFEYKELG